MDIDVNFVKYEFLNNEKIAKAYVTLKKDKTPACDLFRVYGTIQNARFYVCIGKYENYFRNDITLEYLFLNIFGKKCEGIVRVSEFDVQQLTKTNLFLDDIYNVIQFNYTNNFYDAVDFDIAMFFN